MFDKNTVVISASVVFKEENNKPFWLFTKQKEEGDWEITKSLVRRGESSVRTSLRVMGERGGMSVRVLDEAGRISGVVSVNGKTVPQKTLYYLMIVKSAPKELIGFTDYLWLDYSRGIKKIKSKKEQAIFKRANEFYKQRKKAKALKKKKNRISI